LAMMIPKASGKSSNGSYFFEIAKYTKNNPINSMTTCGTVIIVSPVTYAVSRKMPLLKMFAMFIFSEF